MIITREGAKSYFSLILHHEEEEEDEEDKEGVRKGGRGGERGEEKRGEGWYPYPMFQTE